VSCAVLCSDLLCSDLLCSHLLSDDLSTAITGAIPSKYHVRDRVPEISGIRQQAGAQADCGSGCIYSLSVCACFLCLCVPQYFRSLCLYGFLCLLMCFQASVSFSRVRALSLTHTTALSVTDIFFVQPQVELETDGGQVLSNAALQVLHLRRLCGHGQGLQILEFSANS